MKEFFENLSQVEEKMNAKNNEVQSQKGTIEKLQK